MCVQVSRARGIMGRRKKTKFLSTFSEKPTLSSFSLQPIAFNNLLMIRSQLHSYNTRNSSSYTFSGRTNIRQFAIRIQGPRLFNSLNSEICNAANSSLFKPKLKTFLLN